MTKPPNHRDTDYERCDTCAHALWTGSGVLRVVMCKKHSCLTRDAKVCDDWKEEQ